MNVGVETVVRVLAIGIGATAVMDIWAVFARRLFGIPSSDWAMVGRWIGRFPQGQFRHDSMGAASPVRGELAIGWIAHYATGIAYAGMLIAIFGLEWARAPRLGPALLVGVSMLIAPFFIMQPGMGLGIAASRTPRPNLARLRSVMNHVAFGIGLYAAALAISVWC